MLVRRVRCSGFAGRDVGVGLVCGGRRPAVGGVGACRLHGVGRVVERGCPVVEGGRGRIEAVGARAAVDQLGDLVSGGGDDAGRCGYRRGWNVGCGERWHVDRDRACRGGRVAVGQAARGLGLLLFVGGRGGVQPRRRVGGPNVRRRRVDVQAAHQSGQLGGDLHRGRVRGRRRDRRAGRGSRCRVQNRAGTAHPVRIDVDVFPHIVCRSRSTTPWCWRPRCRRSFAGHDGCVRPHPKRRRRNARRPHCGP